MTVSNTKIYTCLIIIFTVSTFVLLTYIRVLCRQASDRRNFIPLHLWPLLIDDTNYTLKDSKMSLDQLSRLVSLNNAELKVRNVGQFGPITAETPIIVIQVHTDVERLQYLVISLAQVRRIESVLLVFSHSYYHNTINELISRITFCKVMQIFYPISLQLYPNRFPGQDYTNVTAKCVSRDESLAERKHHWWWTAYHVFEVNRHLRRRVGHIMFMTERSYVLPDLLHMLNHSRSTFSLFHEVKVLSFGRPLAINMSHDKLPLDAWKPLYANGITFNKSFWNEIWALSSSFCDYNDVNWSYSLLNVFYNMRNRRVLTAVCSMPRVISTATFRSGRDALQKVVTLSRSRQMFPEPVHTVVLYDFNGILVNKEEYIHGNGGWEDPRDHRLCKQPNVEIKNLNLKFDKKHKYISTKLP